MATPTDQYCVDRFFMYFARLPKEDRHGIITGLRATSKVMESAPVAVAEEPPPLIAASYPESSELGEGEPV